MKTVHLTGWDAFKALKVDCMEMLNGHIRDCFKGAGTDYICFESPKTIVESFSRIAATGAKGDFKKVRSLMDNIGITYEEDENGVPIAETAKNITHLKGDTNKACPAIIRDGERDGKDYYRENRMAVQETVAYKADNTSLGGTVAQNFVAAFRDITPENPDDDVLTMKEVLNLAAPITQAILDSKKDPIEAKAKDYIVRFWYRDILEGYKLTGSWKTDDPEVLKNELHEKVIKTVTKGNRTYETPIRCRPV